MAGHGGRQVEIVLEEELRILCIDLKTIGSGLKYWVWLEKYEASKPTPTVTHFLQQDDPYSNKATSSNSATPY